MTSPKQNETELMACAREIVAESYAEDPDGRPWEVEQTLRVLRKHFPATPAQVEPPIAEGFLVEEWLGKWTKVDVFGSVKDAEDWIPGLSSGRIVPLYRRAGSTEGVG